MQTDSIREITKSALAVIVVLGGGVIMATQPDSSAISGITGVIGAVIAYYFASANQDRAIARALEATKP